MPERSGKLLLIILCLLPCSVTSFNCSLSTEEDFLNSFACPCSYHNTSHQFLYGSAECVPRPRPITQMSPMSTLGPGLSSVVFIIVDLAPLIVYFPVLIIFNINLASGPAQSFLFFLPCSYCQLSAINCSYRYRSPLQLSNNAESKSN